MSLQNLQLQLQPNLLADSDESVIRESMLPHHSDNLFYGLLFRILFW